MAALVKKDLEDAVARGCEVPDCTHGHDKLVLNSRCHPGKGVRVSYTRGSGEVEVSCAACRLPVAAIAVATILVTK